MSKYIKLEDAIEAVTSIFRVSALFGGINDDENIWREKAEKVLAKCEVVTGTAKQGLEHIEVSEDCISREYILNGLSEMADDWVINNAVQHGIYEAHDFVKDAPSAERLDQAMKESEE